MKRRVPKRPIRAEHEQSNFGIKACASASIWHGNTKQTLTQGLPDCYVPCFIAGIEHAHRPCMP